MRNLIGKDTNKDAIIAYLTSPENETGLTEKQKQLLNYYVDGYTMIRNYNSVPDTINALVKLSQMRGEPISSATARRYVSDALEVFGYASEMKAEAIQHLATQIIMDGVRMAREAGDYKVMIEGGEKLHKINPKIDSNAPNWDLIERHDVIISLDPQAQKMLDIISGKGYVDLDKLMGNVMNTFAEDAKLIDPNDSAQN